MLPGKIIILPQQTFKFEGIARTSLIIVACCLQNCVSLVQVTANDNCVTGLVLPECRGWSRG